MTPEEQLENLNRQIADLKRQAGDMGEFIPLQNLQDAQRLFTSLKNETSEIGENLSYVAQAFRDSVAELSKQNTELNASKSALKSISNTAQKILTTRSLEGDISVKELASLEKRAKLQFRSLELAVKSGRVRGNALKEAKDALKEEENFFNAIKGIRKEQEEIGKNSGVRLFTGLEDITNAIPGLNKFTGAFKEASIAAKEQARFNKAQFGYAQGASKKQKEINEALKSANGLSKKRIQELGLEKVLVDDTGKQLAGTAAKAKADALGLSKAASNSISPLTAGFRALGPIIKNALGPLVLLKELVSAFKLADKLSGDLAKNLGISYDESLGMVSSMTDIANLSMDTFVTTEGLVKAQTQLSTALGTNAQLSSTLLVDFTKLTEQAGYSAEAATTLGKVSLATGQTAKNITTEFLGQAKALNLSNNLALNEKQLLESVAKVSKGTLATFAGQTDKLSEAIFAAKKLGLEISQVEKIADGLLEIESSLTAEFEAEVITGRQLNLERARYFALTNDIAGVAEELGKQGITQASFAKSSRIEQEAVAAAIGMSRDELGQMLIEQNALAAIGAKDGKEAREKFEALKAQYGEAEAIKRLGDETYAQQLASQSAQERFNKVVSKLQDIFVGLAEPILGIVSPFIDLATTILPAVNLLLSPFIEGIKVIGAGISYVVDSVKSLFGYLTGSNEQLTVMQGIVGTIATIYGTIKGYALATKVIEGIKLGYQAASLGFTAKKNLLESTGLTKSIGQAVFGAISSLSKIPIIGVGLGLTAAAGIAAMAYKYTKGDDIMSPGEGNAGYGKRTLFGPEGAIALNNKDTVIAGTNLFPERGNDRNLQPSGATNVTVSLSRGDIMAIANAVREGASQAKINVNLDGNAVANNLQTPMAMNTRTISV